METKRMGKRFAALLLSLVMLLGSLPGMVVPVLAAPRTVDYNVTVTASDGLGVNIRKGAGAEYDTVKSTPIPMGAVLHITKEQDAENGKTWGYTTYEEKGQRYTGWVSLSQVTRVETTSTSDGSVSSDRKQMLKAYAEKVYGIVQDYGISDSTRSDGAYGLAAAEMLDFNGDGTDELVLVWGADGNICSGIYTYSNGSVRPLWETKSDGFGGIYNVFINRNGNATYMAYGETRHFYSPVLVCVDGRYVKSNGTWTQADEDRVYAAAMEGGLMGEGDMRFTIALEKYGVTDNYATREYLWSYGCEGVFYKYDFVDKTLERLAPYAEGVQRAAAILGNIAYIGDRSKCRMTAEMAEAYAGVLASFSVGGYGMPHALLADVSGDGYPVLLGVGLGEEWGIDSIECDGLTVWEYRDGGAHIYDFAGDSAYGEPGQFSIVRDETGSYLYAESNGGGGVNPIDQQLVYRVSGGKLILTASGERYNYGEVMPDNELDFFTGIQQTTELMNSGSTLFFVYEATPAEKVIAALNAYAEASSPSYTFPKVTEDTDDYVSAIAKAAAEVVGGEVTAIYKLADGVYYVIITVNGSEKAAVVKGVKENGKIVWRVDKKHDTPLAPEELSSFAYGLSGKSNITLDYSQLQGEKDTESITAYLKELLDNMDGITPNDPAKGELAAFLESAMAVLGTGQVTGKDNRLTLDSGTVSDLAQAAKEVKEELEVVLDDNDVTLNKALTIMIRIVWQNMDSGEPCQVALDEELVQALSNCTMQLLLGDGQHYLQISGTNLKKLVDSHGMIYVQMSKVKDGVYTINFLDEDEKVLEQIDVPITVALPSASELNTIMVSYTGGSDNWGGQYDRNTQVITFDARYSGQYEVLENSVDINDITELDEESRQAIAFLVSKGYMTLESGAFRPNDPLNRYEFTSALVGMFFALERGLSCTFPDVEADNPYYDYVASAQARSLVEGFEDGTFGGEKYITVEQMAAIAARTLMDQKGYALPEDAESYLSSYSDNADIANWAREQVALSVREGILDRGGELLPKENVTRAQAAVILYRLFLLLYEVPPVVLELPPVTSEEDTGSAGQPSIAIIVAGGVAAVAAAGGGAAYWVLKKRKIKTQ